MIIDLQKSTHSEFCEILKLDKLYRRVIDEKLWLEGTQCTCKLKPLEVYKINLLGVLGGRVYFYYVQVVVVSTRLT